jgi:hypothetical protein
MKAIYCNQVETLLCDYLDRLLSAGEVTALEEHVAGCPACALTVADMRLAMRYAQEAGAVDVPVELISRILEQTTGQAPAGVPEWRHRLTGWWDRTVSPVVRSVMEPKFALGLAMTVISCSMMLSTAGFDVRRLQWSDLQPANLRTNVTRRVALAGAWATKSYENLRVVYEIQTQLQAWRDDSAANTTDSKQPDAPGPKNGNGKGKPSTGSGNGSGTGAGSGPGSDKDKGSKTKDNRSTDSSQPKTPFPELHRRWTAPLTMAACALWR